ncbi:hypothetical protein EOK75_09645 [Pseudorhodobacter turbinis]|uniref:VPLPA-CTERM sorting domain-containing protein n=1 Tax=Pseudorhodobacter turbinis TaxID=2500533 RepID=A0A4P8EFT4_9RHOB|nr:hypothetical protein [Pseudorhodobacter turbinis]QCO55980.1 hypothetical protein EOK75_09645 [Pseudorhodobacter turbinis]
MKKIVLTAFSAVLAMNAGSANAATFDLIVNYLPAGVIIDSDGDGNTATGAQNPTEAFSARQIQLFGAAETFWETVLTGFTGLTNAVYTLDAWMTYEDGSDGSLAFAGPRSFATQSGFDRAIGGFMQFDSADFGADAEFPQSEQLFLDSAIHEVAHALGFGTQFEFNDLVDATGNNYIGENALAVFNAVNGTSVSSILLENGGGHWNECWVAGLDGAACLPEDGTPALGLFNDPELMTPFAVDIPATLSPTTIAAFRDLGYETIDPYAAVSIPLAANIGTTPSPVPLPASGLLLLGALGFVPALRRKSKRA